MKRVHFSASFGSKTFCCSGKWLLLTFTFHWEVRQLATKRSPRVIYFTKCSRSFVTWLQLPRSLVKIYGCRLRVTHGSCEHARVPMLFDKPMDYDGNAKILGRLGKAGENREKRRCWLSTRD